MLDRIQEFQSVKHVALDGKICWNAFELKSYKNLLTPMKDKTKQIEIQAHIFQKSSIIVKRFPVWYCYNIAHAQTRHFSAVTSSTLENGVFFSFTNL